VEIEIHIPGMHKKEAEKKAAKPGENAEDKQNSGKK
jgi:hypothetical protein